MTYGHRLSRAEWHLALADEPTDHEALAAIEEADQELHEDIDRDERAWEQ